MSKQMLQFKSPITSFAARSGFKTEPTQKTGDVCDKVCWVFFWKEFQLLASKNRPMTKSYHHGTVSHGIFQVPLVLLVPEQEFVPSPSFQPAFTAMSRRLCFHDHPNSLFSSLVLRICYEDRSTDD